MRTNGIRILDKKKNILSVDLNDILNEVQNGDSLAWSVQFIDGILKSGTGISLNELKRKINIAKDGLRMDWKSLFSLSSDFSQLYEIVVLASKDENQLRRYNTEQEMYGSCDIVIELIDSAFWEVYSKNENLILKLKQKFKNVETLEL